jgi:hypothetical protein
VVLSLALRPIPLIVCVHNIRTKRRSEAAAPTAATLATNDAGIELSLFMCEPTAVVVVAAVAVVVAAAAAMPIGVLAGADVTVSRLVFLVCLVDGHWNGQEHHDGRVADGTAYWSCDGFRCGWAMIVHIWQVGRCGGCIWACVRFAVLYCAEVTEHAQAVEHVAWNIKSKVPHMGK